MIRRTRLLALALALVALAASPAHASPRFVPPLTRELVVGRTPGLVIEGLEPRSEVGVQALRTLVAPRDSAGAVIMDTVRVRSWARLAADADGRIAIDATAPQAGTWRGADPLGPLWSMRAETAPARDGRAALWPPPGRVRWLLTDAATAARPDLRHLAGVKDSLTLRLVRAPAEVASRSIDSAGVIGGFAYPRGVTRAPTLLLLHGSEGSDTTSALALAKRFASQGYAAFAPVYVGYPYRGTFTGIPAAFDSLPLETLDRARAWLGSQPEADTSRMAVWGVSKGGELAIVAAAFRPWVQAAVACVPSDVVWAGFGREPPTDEPLSSWSIAGRRLPAIAYDRYNDVFEGRATAREVHDRSRRLAAARLAEVRIPIERTNAALLLLGSDQDEVWASATMVREIARTLARAGKGEQVEVATFARAGHDICGDGTSPGASFGAGPAPSPDATAEAGAASWRRTLAFLERWRADRHGRLRETRGGSAVDR